jgi:outer membrane immunogenic protein
MEGLDAATTFELTMKGIISVKTILAGAALAVVAIAATPAVAQVVQGPRVEIHGGADILRQKIDGFSSPNVRLNDTGILYGVGVGYDFAVSEGLSIGIEADLDRSNAKLEKTFLDAVAGGINAEYRLKPRYDAFIGARVSFPVSDVSNFYLKGGYSRASFRESSRVVNTKGATPVVVSSARDSGHVGGIRGGVGAQVAFARSAYFGAEVQYTKYKSDISRIGALLALGLRFGSRPVEDVIVAPAPVAPAPEPAPAPATQTCADGSVILATDACPAVAPLPAPAPERG